MRYLLIPVFIFSFTFILSAEENAADQLHKTAAEDLSAASSGFDTAGKKPAGNKTGKKPVYKYTVKDAAGNNAIVDDEAIPEVSTAASVSAGDINALMLQSLGAGPSAGYKGTYETGVGEKKEKKIDISGDIEKAKREQAAADKKFAAENPAPSSASQDKGSDIAAALIKSIAAGMAAGKSQTVSENPNSSAGACKNFCKKRGFGSYQYNSRPPSGWSKCGCV